jgi:hypothetical protein
VNTFDAQRIATLAARLGVTPRQLLALAARVAQQPEAKLDPTRLEVELARVRAAGEVAEAAADLAILGYGAFAFDDIDNGLALAWSSAQARGL